MLDSIQGKTCLELGGGILVSEGVLWDLEVLVQKQFRSS